MGAPTSAQRPELGAGWGFAVNPFYGGDPAELAEMMHLGVSAEQAGFDSIWVGDHVVWHTPFIDAMTLLSTYVTSTNSVDLGMGVYLLGLRQPALAAKTVLTLNALSEGRLVLGIGVGGENPAEFEAAGVPFEARGKRLDAAIDYLLAQWDSGDPRAQIAPTGPPLRLLVGGRSNAWRRRTIRLEAGWLAIFVSPRRIADERVLLAEGIGRDVPIALNLYMRTGPDDERAQREADEFLGRVYNTDGPTIGRYAATGTPERCAEEVRRYWDAGVRHFVLRPAAWDQRGQLEQWGEQVLPLLADLA